MTPYRATPLVKRGDWAGAMLEVLTWPVALTLLKLKSIYRLCILLTLMRLDQRH